MQTEIKISAHEPLRFKYKLFHIDELENGSLNNFVFCSLKQERLVASFVICPPLVGRYYFKIYAKSEKDLQDQNPANASLHYISTILLECTKARKYQNPYPLNELPYGNILIMIIIVFLISHSFPIRSCTSLLQLSNAVG